MTIIIHKARKTFYTDFVDDNSCDLGKLFRGMKALLAPKDNLCFPDYRDNRALADELEIVRAAMKEEDKVKDDPVVMENQRIYEFRQLFCEDNCSLVQKSAKRPVPSTHRQHLWL